MFALLQRDAADLNLLVGVPRTGRFDAAGEFVVGRIGNPSCFEEEPVAGVFGRRRCRAKEVLTTESPRAQRRKTKSKRRTKP